MADSTNLPLGDMFVGQSTHLFLSCLELALPVRSLSRALASLVVTTLDKLSKAFTAL